jgi:hypothetical protein
VIFYVADLGIVVFRPSKIAKASLSGEVPLMEGI